MRCPECGRPVPASSRDGVHCAEHDLPADGLDFDYLTEWSRERQNAAYTHQHRGGDLCRCGHRWHGLPCTEPAPGGLCPCPSAWREAV